MSDYTKGKWEVKNVSDVENVKIGIMTKKHQICGIEPGKSASGLLSEQTHLAHARLIAAAPDLLAACKESLREFKLILNRVIGFDETGARNKVPIERQLEQAIAKAKEQDKE